MLLAGLGSLLAGAAAGVLLSERYPWIRPGALVALVAIVLSGLAFAVAGAEHRPWVFVVAAAVAGTAALPRPLRGSLIAVGARDLVGGAIFAACAIAAGTAPSSDPWAAAAVLVAGPLAASALVAYRALSTPGRAGSGGPAAWAARLLLRPVDVSRLVLGTAAFAAAYLALALGLAVVEQFHLVTVPIALAVAALAARGVYRRASPGKVVAPAWGALLLAVAVGLVVVPYQNFSFQGRDQAVYSSEAHVLAATGSLYFGQETLGAYSGFVTTYWGTSTIQFFHYYPLALATLELLAPGWAQAILNWGSWALAVLAVVAVASEFRGVRRGVLAWLVPASVVLLTYPALWFMREPLSENLFVPLFLAWTLAASRNLRGKASTPLCFALAASASLVKIEGLAFLVATFGLHYLREVPDPARATFADWGLATLGAAGLGVTAVLLNYEYFITHIDFFFIARDAASRHLGVTVGLLAGASAVTFVHRRFGEPFRLVAGIVLAIALLAFGGVVVAYALRGFPEVATWNAFAPMLTGRLFARYGLLLPLVAGVVALALRSRDPTARIVAIGLLAGALFFFRPLIAVDQPWFMRRFLSFALPSLWVGLSAGILALLAREGRLQRSAAVAAWLVVALSLAAPLRALPSEGLNPESREALDRIADALPEGSLLLFDNGWQWQRWSYYLEFVRGVACVPIPRDLSSAEIRALAANATHAYYLTQQEGDRHPLFRNAGHALVREFDLPQDRYEGLRLNGYVLDSPERLVTDRFAARLESEVPPRLDRQVLHLYLYEVDAGRRA